MNFKRFYSKKRNFLLINKRFILFSASQLKGYYLRII
jgi:hypothetical protein